jgi:O-antigen ligase
LNEEQFSRITVILDVLSFQTENIDYSGRDFLLDNMLNYIAENPLLGNGIQFSNSIRGHNTIIGIWADAGVLAFMLLVIILIAYILRSLAADRDTKYFSLSVLTTLIIFMLTLQTVINQTYLMVVFAFLGFILSKDTVKRPNSLNLSVNDENSGNDLSYRSSSLREGN